MKKILLILSVLAVAVFGTYTVTQSSNSIALDDLQIENLEALGGDEDKWCPWGVAEYYKANDERWNCSHSSYCDCTPISYYRSRRSCTGEYLCSDAAWSAVLYSGK